MPVANPSHLLPNEELSIPDLQEEDTSRLSDADINEKYIRGEIRIVTEQARYPISSIKSIVESENYTLSPEYQRRHRWGRHSQSRLIESLIMNVPIPPIFLYEYDFSKYEVMDGLQRLTAISEYYNNVFELSGLTEWMELNGKKYNQLPEKIREGIDRRYLSSVILLKETARNEQEALRLKQLVFERLNSGGVRLSSQETRNALFNGRLNQLCLVLSRHPSLCRLWGIPEPTEEEESGGTLSDELLSNEDFRQMSDVELVLRFFANRQRHNIRRSGQSLKVFLDTYLQQANRDLSEDTLRDLGLIFRSTIALIEEVFGDKAFFLYRKRMRGGVESWGWFERPTLAAYEPLMFVVSSMLDRAADMRRAAAAIVEGLPEFYQGHYSDFEGRNVNASDITTREQAYRDYLNSKMK
ncbi:DUF262 domain-containing protein (plasmid) [Segnochrobactraceae bacterium EtOH-i3]